MLLFLLGLAGQSRAEEIRVGPLTYNYDAGKGICTLLSCDKGTSGKVTVPASIQVAGRDVKVQGIAAKAFEECRKLEEVEIADGVTKVIEEGTFLWCKALKRVKLPAELREIKREAFNNSRLPSIELPEGLRIIGEEAFSGTDLKSVKLPESLKYLGKMAFAVNAELQSIEIPSGLEGIDEGVFQSCIALETVTLHEQLKYIGRGAFMLCTELKTILKADGVQSIGEDAFSGCWALSSFTVPPRVRHLSKGVFLGCKNLESVQLPVGLRTIGRIAFAEAEKLRAISIPEGVTYIGPSAFSSCTALESIVIPDGVRRIEEKTFDYCTNLRSVVFSARSIGPRAFADCHKLQSVARFGNTSGGEPVDVEREAFKDCKRLTELGIDIGKLGAEALVGCSNLQSYTFGYGHTQLDPAKYDPKAVNTTLENLATIYLSGPNNAALLTKLFRESFTSSPGFYAAPSKLKGIYIDKRGYGSALDALARIPAWNNFFKGRLPVASYDFQVPSSLQLAVGEEKKVKVAKLEPVFFRVKWESNDESVVTVSDDGLASGKQEGVAVIIARIAGTRISRQVRVTVGKGKGVASIAVDPAAAEVFLGESLQLRAQVLPADASDKSLAWQVQNGISAAVSHQGKLTPTLVGRSKVRAFQPWLLAPVQGLSEVNVKARLRFKLDGGTIDNGSGNTHSVAEQVVEETKPEPIPYDARAKYKSPGTPVKPGYTFMGWYTAEGVKFDGFDRPPDGSYDLIARWEPITVNGSVEHKVSFDLDGGLYDGQPTIPEQMVVDGQPVSEPEAGKLSKSGHRFKHWVDAATSQTYVFGLPLTKDLTLRAVWESAGGPGGGTLPAPTKHKVTFDLDGGLYDGNPTIPEQTVADGQPVTEPEAGKLRKSGHRFKHWVDAATGQPYVFGSPLTKELTLRAVWESTGGPGGGTPPAPTKHKVTFDLDGGLYDGNPTIPEQTVADGQPVTEPEAGKLSKSGHRFKHWVDAATGQPYVFGSPLAKALTLRAVWESTGGPGGGTPPAPTKHKVSFDLDGGLYDGQPTIPEQTVADGQPVTAPEAGKLSKSGHRFKHWVDAATGQLYVFGSPLTKALTLRAVWEPVGGPGGGTPPAPVEHKVTFDLDGGLYDGNPTIPEQTVADGQPVTEPEAGKLSKSGHRFRHWIDTSTGQPYVFGSPLTKSLMLSAVWEAVGGPGGGTPPAPVEHRVSFDLDGGLYDGQPTIPEQTVADGQPVTEPEAGKLNKAGHRFKHWVDAATGQPYVFGSSLTKDLTLRAVWEAIGGPGGGTPPAPTKHKVSFDLDGGLYDGQPTIPEQTVADGQPVTAPEAGKLSKSGHRFKHWVDAATGQPYAFGSPLTKELMLKAVWEPVGGSGGGGGNLGGGGNGPKRDGELLGPSPVEAASLARLAVFPNPAVDFIVVEGLTERVAVQIYSLQSKLVYTGMLAPAARLDVRDLQPGTYLLRVNSQTLRFVKR